MPEVGPGRMGRFSDSELAEAERRGHVTFLGRLGIGPATNGRFKDIDYKAVRRRAANSFYTMADAEFDEAWTSGHIKFLGDAWGAKPDYFRRLRTRPFQAGPGWKKSTTITPASSHVSMAAPLKLGDHVRAIRKLAQATRRQARSIGASEQTPHATSAIGRRFSATGTSRAIRCHVDLAKCLP